MFVRGDFIEEHWDWIGCWTHIDVCGKGVCMGAGIGRSDYIEFAEFLCR